MCTRIISGCIPDQKTTFWSWFSPPNLMWALGWNSGHQSYVPSVVTPKSALQPHKLYKDRITLTFTFVLPTSQSKIFSTNIIHDFFKNRLTNIELLLRCKMRRAAS